MPEHLGDSIDVFKGIRETSEADPRPSGPSAHSPQDVEPSCSPDAAQLAEFRASAGARRANAARSTEIIKVY